MGGRVVAKLLIFRNDIISHYKYW